MMSMKNITEEEQALLEVMFTKKTSITCLVHLVAEINILRQIFKPQFVKSLPFKVTKEKYPFRLESPCRGHYR